MSKTPLLDTLKSLNHDRYHIPGHKGKTPEDFPSVFEIDFTEITPTGNLYLADGPIAKSENLYKDMFHAGELIYLTGGSSQGILASVFCAKPKKILCDRNSHKALCHALMMVDPLYDFINPSVNVKFNLPDKINPQAVEEKLSQDNDIDTVYITSPNYFGICSDIEGIAKACNKHGAKLIVDEAHGCHFPAIGVKNAMQSGADFAITSAHKTTESLGQGAMLMVAQQNTNARQCASVFGTSSPSYAIMASIENALSNMYKYKEFIPKVEKLRADIAKNTDFLVLDNDDICRLVVNTNNFSKSGNEISEILENEYSIIAEMSNAQNIVFILTYNDDKLEHLLSSLSDISNKLNKIYKEYKKITINSTPKRAMSIREAMFCDGENIDINEALGKMSYEMICPYPPGVPILYPGEIICQEIIELVQNLCYTNINFIKIISDR